MPHAMEYTGFEPVASTMRMLRAPNCANTPYENYSIFYRNGNTENSENIKFIQKEL